MRCTVTRSSGFCGLSLLTASFALGGLHGQVHAQCFHLLVALRQLGLESLGDVVGESLRVLEHIRDRLGLCRLGRFRGLLLLTLQQRQDCRVLRLDLIELAAGFCRLGLELGLERITFGFRSLRPFRLLAQTAGWYAALRFRRLLAGELRGLGCFGFRFRGSLGFLSCRLFFSAGFAFRLAFTLFALAFLILGLPFETFAHLLDGRIAGLVQHRIVVSERGGEDFIAGGIDRALELSFHGGGGKRVIVLWHLADLF